MKVTRKGSNAEIDSPGAVTRYQPDIGNVTQYGDIAAEYFPLFEGTDTTELLEGLKNDHCQSANWGYVPSDKLTVSYTDSNEEADERGDVYSWPLGETPRVDIRGV